MQEMWVQSLSWEDPLEKEMATHSSILAWRIPRTEEPCGLQSMGSQRVRHDWATEEHFILHQVTDLRLLFEFLGWCFCVLYFFFKLYKIVLVLPNIKMDLPQVYMCSPSWTLLPPPSPYHPSGSSQCTSPKHPVSCIEPGLASPISW